MVACLLIGGVFVTKSSAEQVRAQQAAERFEQSLAPTAAPVRRPIVAVIGDELAAPAQTGAPTAEWPLLMSRTLHITVDSLSSAGSGYTTRPLSSFFGGTFPARAQEISPDSRAVIFFGGGNDQRSTKQQIQSAAGAAIANARQAAPSATIIMIGPGSISADASTSVIKVRDALKSVAVLTGTTFVDPIDGKWLSSGTKYFAADHQSLTAKGERAIAARVERVLRPILAK